MKSIRMALILIVALTSCRQSTSTPDLTPTSNQVPTRTTTPFATPDLEEWTRLTEPQMAAMKLKALCCKDGWWDYLIAAENKSREAKNNGEEIDTGAVFLESLDAAGEKFDANEYFTVLTHLALEEGNVLDYVYFAPGGDGTPYIYARLKEAPAFANYSEYQEASGENYLDHIQVDDSAESIYELALLSIMGGQYYLSWHFEYNDWEVVSSRERLEAIIDLLKEKYTPLPREKEAAALQLDIAPRVKFEGEKALVRIVVFTKWGGFYERIYSMNRKFPHQIMHEDIEIIPYHCGIVF